MTDAGVPEVRLPDGSSGGGVRGRIHLPASGASDVPTLLLTHGAGGNLDTPGLIALAASLADRDVRTLRFNLPAAEAGKRRPDRPGRALACIAAVLEWAAREFAGPLFVGGRSFGGRMASLLLADETAAARRPAVGLVLLAYPLKPPGKPVAPPERMQHLRRIGVPMLFVSGDRDPFAPPGLLDPVAAACGARVRWITGGDHGFRVSRGVLAATGRTAAAVREEIAGAVEDFIASTAAAV